MPEKKKATTSPYISVRRSKIHGTGVFAKKAIPEGAKIIEYVGEKITKKESDRRGPALIEAAAENNEMGAVYLFELNSRYDVDGNVPYNTARFINHSCSPNCETEIVNGGIWVLALRGIKKGEELSYNYGYDLSTYKDHPCRCGADNCMGYIVAEDSWPRLRGILTRKKTAQKKKTRTKKRLGAAAAA